MGPGDENCGREGNSALERGLALFNRGEFFHAHEVWEDWWRATTHPEKQTIQGMVQLAVSMHHFSTGNLAGAKSVMKRALRNLEGAQTKFHGVDMVQLRSDMQSFMEELKTGNAPGSFRIHEI
jgi:uncharacterized protein